MEQSQNLPKYNFRKNLPSLWQMLRSGVSDTASVIPDSILDEPAIQLPGLGAPLVIADPELARIVLTDREQLFTRDRMMRRLMRRAWGKGLAAAEGEDWSAQRKAATPAFTPAAVNRRIFAFASAAEKAAKIWPLSQQVELNQQIAPIIAEIVFSTLIDGKGKVDTNAVAADMPSYIRRISRFNNLDLLPLPEAVHDQLAGIASDATVQRLRAAANRLAQNLNVGSGDMISMLSGIGPTEDNILGLMPAAMDTTVSGASWALYTLASLPQWQSRVADEARACGGKYTADALPLTRRVVKEALRLYPPAPMLVRTANSALSLGGHRVRAGQSVAISIYAMHRHRKLWVAPDTFDPDRFLTDRSANNPAWMPFGTGPRMCIAAQFALTEIMVIISSLLAELEFEPLGPTPQVMLQVTARSSNGLSVTARRRDPLTAPALSAI